MTDTERTMTVTDNSPSIAAPQDTLGRLAEYKAARLAAPPDPDRLANAEAAIVRAAQARPRNTGRNVIADKLAPLLAAENPTPQDVEAAEDAALADMMRTDRRAPAAILAEPGTGPLPVEKWEAQDPPARDWIIRNTLPAGRLASLYGQGGTGKSMFALQLAAAIMHGGAPLKPKPRTDKADTFKADHPLLQPIAENKGGRVLWLTWEDETDEVLRRWRMAHHADAISKPFPSPDFLSLVDMRKIGGPLWGPEHGRHVSTAATWTAAGRRFLAMLKGHRLAVIDPLAAAFASSEIDRALARAFTSAIDGEAEAAGCAVLLIAHPSQSGSASGGGGYSGSTDWLASVRAMLNLELSDETAHTADDGKGDKNPKASAYRLRIGKASYAPDGGHLWLARHWQAEDRERNAPAELAWFGAKAGNAAKAYEAANSRKAGREPRKIKPVEKGPSPAASNRNGGKEDGGGIV